MGDLGSFRVSRCIPSICVTLLDYYGMTLKNNCINKLNGIVTLKEKSKWKKASVMTEFIIR